jgi:hypothetical protein
MTKEITSLVVGDQLRISVELIEQIRAQGDPVLCRVAKIVEDKDGTKELYLERVGS